MAKLTIIDVDLGQDVESIIADDVKSLTAKNQSDIDKALEQKQSVLKERNEKLIKTTNAERQSQEALEKVYNALLVAKQADMHLSLEKMVEISSPVITSSSALVMRLQTYIKKFHGNKYVLNRITRDKKPAYQLINYNVES